MPAQKNCVPSVVMNDGMPIFAMMRPLMKPTRTPEASPAMTASQPRSYSLNKTAKTNPEKAMIEGKERSISPPPITKVRPVASRMSGGRVERKVV